MAAGSEYEWIEWKVGKAPKKMHFNPSIPKLFIGSSVDVSIVTVWCVVGCQRCVSMVSARRGGWRTVDDGCSHSSSFQNMFLDIFSHRNYKQLATHSSWLKVVLPWWKRCANNEYYCSATCMITADVRKMDTIVLSNRVISRITLFYAQFYL